MHVCTSVRKVNLQNIKYFSFCINTKAATRGILLNNFPISTGKHLGWSFFLIQLQASNFTKKRLQQRSFSVNFAKFLRTPILKNICERLLLLTERIISHSSKHHLSKLNNSFYFFLKKGSPGIRTFAVTSSCNMFTQLHKYLLSN